MYKIGIIRESRSDDNRTPLVPKHIKELLNKFNNISIIIQPSNHRCFNDKEYLRMGALINEDLDACDLILGIKEIEPNLLINSKKYMFFSHTSKIQPDNSAAAQGTPGMDKKELINEILKKKITLIDYENIRDKFSRRYLGFGRFAGIIGCYNSLNLYLETIGEPVMSRAYDLGSYSKLLQSIEKKDFKNARILITGDGRVAKGTLELLKSTNINEVSPENFLKDKNSLGVFCNLQTSQYLKRLDDQKFNLQHFIKFPNKYLNEIIDKNDYEIICFGFKPSLMQKKLGGHTYFEYHNNSLKNVFIKNKINSDDLGLAGFFWFKRGKLVSDIAQYLVNVKSKIKRELIIDDVIKYSVSEGLNVGYVQLEDYKHLGTYEEFKEFEYWEKASINLT